MGRRCHGVVAFIPADSGDSGTTKEPPIDKILKAANNREKNAEVRDRAAEERDRSAASDGQLDGADDHDRALSSIDRTHSGRDRDAAAIDRAALIEGLRQDPQQDRPASPE